MAELRNRLGRKSVLRNRSEVIRAAIQAMSRLSDADLETCANAVPQLKPGRKIQRREKKV